MASKSTSPKPDDDTLEAQAPEAIPAVAAKPADATSVDPASLPIPMTHPDGGTSDRYETDINGNVLVPQSDVGEMTSHGFVVVDNITGEWEA